jgi:hypothetical protein
MQNSVLRLKRSNNEDAFVLHLIGDEAIVFSRNSKRLYWLNTSATFMWCCHEDGMEPPEIADALAKRFGVNKRLALRDTTRALAELKAVDMLDAPTAEARPQRGASEENTSLQPAVPRRVAPHSERLYRLLDLRLRIRYPCERTAELAHPILTHLETAPSDLEPGSTILFEITESPRGYALFKDARLVSRCRDQAELAPMIQREVLLAAYEATECLAAIHAAAVFKQDRCILMPAAKGSGKSTLTAGLLATGYAYLTDELSVLMPGSGDIRPAPVSLGLKYGSWPVLAPIYPTLKNLPTHLQAGEIKLRYLTPPSDSLPSRQAYPVTHIVFPQYRAGKPTALKPLGHAEALWRIAEGGYAVQGRLNQTEVERLIDWILPLPCYELSIGSLEGAISELERLA